MTKNNDFFIPRLIEAPDRADQIVTRSALASSKPPEPLISNALDQGTVAVLYGPWGVGKTFVAIDLAACVATGRPWQGRKTKQAKVLYVAAEGAQGFDKRLAAWEQAWSYPISDDQFHVYPLPVNLMDYAEVDDLINRIHGEYEFVIVDTLARCIVGADENSARDMGIAVNSLDRIRRATGTVLAVHHTGKDGHTLRGSSALEGAADTIYATSKDGAGFLLDRKKRKEGPLVDRHHLQLSQVADSCIVEVRRPDAGPSQSEEARRLAEVEGITFDAARKRLQRAQKVSPPVGTAL
ncbi:helicase RepA family protein [Mycolicibacterium sphagni]|uniref:AAA+ ATPase domain-containing protein n=1 Tax=Mycolicibacterium sphagni TaxID=1786 RepID=A0A255DDT9_9MYCO|nr:helicase RepA family protein [Mycolicibacterium sphagni]OYN77474.1 hypothetical protein CG716_18225 [Mycolicibacterium sphagni]